MVQRKKCKYFKNHIWVPCVIKWEYLSNSLKIYYRGSKSSDDIKTRVTRCDHVFMVNSILTVEAYEANKYKMYQFKEFDVAALIKHVIENGAMRECSWIIPLMHQIGAFQ